MVDSVGADYPKVQELRILSLRSEGQVWCGPRTPWRGVGRLASVQCRQWPARAGPLDAHGDHPEPVVGGQSLARIWRR